MSIAGKNHTTHLCLSIKTFSTKTNPDMSHLPAEDAQRLAAYMQTAKERAEFFIGYPIARDFDYSELYPLLALPLNNVGDPQIESTYDLNSRSLEKEVLEFFAGLFKAPPTNWWGYVTRKISSYSISKASLSAPSRMAKWTMKTCAGWYRCTATFRSSCWRISARP
jgi:hypothetical protein